MQVREVLRLSVGSCVVYFVIAACSGYAEETKAPSGAQGPDATSETGPFNPVPSALAEGHKSGSRLKLRFYEGADGSRQFIDFFDTELQSVCSVQHIEGESKHRCVPVITGTLYYSDTACKVPAFYATSKSALNQPTIGVDSGDPFSSPPVITYHRLGPLANPPAKLYTLQPRPTSAGAECAERTITTTQNYYAVVAPIAPTAFMEMTIKNE